MPLYVLLSMLLKMELSTFASEDSGKPCFAPFMKFLPDLTLRAWAVKAVYCYGAVLRRSDFLHRSNFMLHYQYPGFLLYNLGIRCKQDS